MAETSPLAKLMAIHKESYKDMPVDEFIGKIREKNYPDIPEEQFLERLGLVAPPSRTSPAAPSTMERIGEAGWNLLPSATTMMSGLRGAQMGARGGPLGVAIGGILGAATGGAVGEAGKEAAFDGGEPGDIFNAGLSGAKTGAESEMLGGIVSKPLLGALQWAKAPALKAWEAAGDGAKIAMAKFRDMGLPYNPAQLAPSPTGKVVQGIAGGMDVGKNIVADKATELHLHLSRMRGEVIGEALDIPQVRGIPTLNIAKVGRPIIKEKTSGAYEAARTQADPAALVKVPKIRQTMGALLQNPVFAGDKKAAAFFKDWLKKSEPGMLSLHDLDLLQSKINTATGASKNAAGAEGLFAAFADDLTGWDKEVGGKIVEAYGKARGAAREGFGFEAVSRVFGKATKLTADGSAEVFNPATARAILDQQTPTILRTFGKERGADIVRKLSDYIALTQGAIPIAPIRGVGSAKTLVGTSVIGGALGITGGRVPSLGEVGTGIVAGVVLPWGTSKAAAASLMNPKGYMHRWLSSTKRLTPEFKTRLNRAIVMGAYEGLDDD